MSLQVSGGVDDSADPDLAEAATPDPAGLGWPDLDGVRNRIGVWRALLDRPLTSYYLVLGVTTLLLGLGLVMVESTASVADLIAGLSPTLTSRSNCWGRPSGCR